MLVGRVPALKTLARQLLPPAALTALREVRRRRRGAPRDWEYVPEGWRALLTEPNLRGWDVPSVAAAYRQRWDAYRAAAASPLPLGITPEHVPGPALAQGPYGDLDVLLHNTVMSYAYALARGARGKAALSLLDWGGGVGHYYHLSRALLPDLALAYHCKDLPGTIAVGRQLLPEATFYDDDRCFERTYDLVLASGSLQYAPEWPGLVGRLAAASAGYVFVNQLPVVHRAPSFVFVQRPYGHGYATEFLGWCLRRGEFLAAAEQHGLRLVREFVNGFKPPVHRAPEPPEYRGFLFAARPA
jgi:putative methyltransferase (TIGR04325 family)